MQTLANFYNMLRLKNLVALSLLAFFAGCAFKTPPEDYKSANPAMADPAKTFTSSLESTALQPLVLGNWQGSLPCADCEGITYFLTLQKDKTFQESSEYRGKSVIPVTQRGTWLVNEDSVVQLTKPSGQSYLAITKNNLVLLDQNGRRINSELAARYVLHRTGNGSTGETALEEKRRAGIDFTASAASWNLDIDAEKAIHFRTQNGKINLTSSVPTVQKLPAGKGFVYRAITDAGTLAVRVTNQPCADKPSGQTLPYSVEVTANAQAYTGCGQFLNAPSLAGKWTLQEMNGTALKAADFSRGLPQLELQPETGKAMGNGGCNRISGELKLTGEQVSFGAMISTRMACPGPAMTFENNYLKLLSEKTFTYQVENNRLTLKQNGTPVLVYAKTE